MMEHLEKSLFTWLFEPIMSRTELYLLLFPGISLYSTDGPHIEKHSRDILVQFYGYQS